MDFYQRNKIKIGFEIIIVLFFLAVGGFFSCASDRYVKIVDGDSLEIGSRRIRLLEIDAPEYQQFCYNEKRKKYDCGKEAKLCLQNLLKKAHFKVNCHTQYKDRYKRDLAICYAGNINLNLEMIRLGCAVTYRTENQVYLEAEKEAKKLKRGVWCGKFMRPEYYRRLHRR